MKLERLELLPPTLFGEGSSDRVMIYPFPPRHIEEFPSLPYLFTNVAALLSRDRLPSYVPVLGFETPVHKQFYHATLPLFYKGLDPAEYTASERQVIGSIENYFVDTSDWGRTDRGDLYVPPSCSINDPRLLRIANPLDGPEFVQLFIRKKYCKNDEIETRALVDKVRHFEIFFFKQQMETYEGWRGTPA